MSGELISNNLDQQLASEGYNIKRMINYIAKPIEAFDQSFINKLKLKWDIVTPLGVPVEPDVNTIYAGQPGSIRGNLLETRLISSKNWASSSIA